MITDIVEYSTGYVLSFVQAFSEIPFTDAYIISS